MLTQLDGIGMMELEELERKEIINIHIEYIILLIAFNKGTFSTTTDDLADSRSNDVDELTADQVHDLAEEQQRLRDKRRSTVMEKY